MKTKFISKALNYDGSQLRSHFAFESFNIVGDSIVSFIGGCEVSSHMVDLADKKKNEFIYSEKMLHFIIEHFDDDLEKAILRKRLLICVIHEELSKLSKKIFIRKDNGIYFGNKKLTVAIATKSGVSTLIHIALNISSKNTPVKTISLNDLNISAGAFAKTILKRYLDEINSIKISRAKVMSVK